MNYQDNASNELCEIHSSFIILKFMIHQQKLIQLSINPVDSPIEVNSNAILKFN